MFRYNNIPKIGRVKYGVTMFGQNPYVIIAPGSWSYPFNPTYGINAGGYNGSGQSNLYERATYSTETNATNAARLSTALYLWGQSMASSTKCLACGGSSPATNVIRVYTYASDTAASSASTLTSNRDSGGGGTGTTIGYIILGNPSGTVSTEKITISTEVVVAGPNLSFSSNDLPRCAGDATNLYVVGSATTAVDKINFAANTASTMTGTTVYKRNRCFMRINSGGTQIYTLGGTGNKGGAEKMTLSTETFAATNNLTVAQEYGSTQGSSTKIYCVGGNRSDWNKATQGYTTSTDTAAETSGMNGIAIVTWGAGS